MSKILIVEDEDAIRRVLKKVLIEESSKYIIDEAINGDQAISLVKTNNYDLVLCDIKMPKMDGIEVLQATKKIKPDIPFVMISGHGDLETAVNSMRLGAYDYIAKPPDLNRLLNSVRNALEKKKLVTENNSLRIKVSRKYEMVGNSIPIKTVKSIIDKVSSTEARVLITGSNGTGKELVAHWIHQKSNRRHRPLVEVNCAAIPSELIESELFGHLKGAFTGANKERTGKFEAADGGTLFLDEIGDMSLSAQAKVLRALQENKVQRVGSDKDIKVNVRVLAATNKDLKNEIKGGRFREDLYHRLAVIMIEVPSLNDRREDIPMLIEYFSNKISDDHGDKPKQFSKKAIDMLKGFNWTGNVRELRNVVERLIILGSQPVSVDDVKSFVTKL